MHESRAPQGALFGAGRLFCEANHTGHWATTLVLLSRSSLIARGRLLQPSHLPIWLIRELSRQGRRLFYARMKHPLRRKRKGRICGLFTWGPRLRRTSLSHFTERLAKCFASEEKVRPVDDLLAKHGPAERRLSTNDLDCRTKACGPLIT